MIRVLYFQGFNDDCQKKSNWHLIWANSVAQGHFYAIGKINQRSFHVTKVQIHRCKKR